MRKYLTVEERLKVIDLSEEGMAQKDIAKSIGRSNSLVSHLINSGRDKVMRMRVYANSPERKENNNIKPVEEVELSSLPDSVLFKEVNWNIP